MSPPNLLLLPGTSSRFIILHGPVGCGKSTACRVLLKELSCNVRQWDSDTTPPTTGNFDDRSPSDHDAGVAYTSILNDFARFLRESYFPALSLSSTSKSHPISQSIPLVGSVAILESLPALAPSKFSYGENSPVHNLLLDSCLHSTPGSALILILSGQGEFGLSPAELQQSVGTQALMYANVIQFKTVPPGRLEKRLKEVAEREGLESSNVLALVGNGDLRAGLNALQFGGKEPSSRFAPLHAFSLGLVFLLSSFVYSHNAQNKNQLNNTEKKQWT